MLDGMWALAYFNKLNDDVILSRDRFGEKPFIILLKRADSILATQ